MLNTPLLLKLRIKHPLGLHVRPCTTIVKHLSSYQAEVFFTCKETTANAKSIIGLLSLAASGDADITVSAEGEDAALALDSLLNMPDSPFEEVF